MSNYEVTIDGRVISYNGYHKSSYGKELKQQLRNGYLAVPLPCKKRKRTVPHSVHRLVAECYIPNPENKAQVNHKDGNKLNNHVDNLEWVTSKENVIHAVDNDLKKKVPVYQYHKSGNLIKRWDSLKHAADYYNIKEYMISNTIHGRQKTSNGFVWKLQ